jgi:hypothetical protein
MRSQQYCGYFSLGAFSSLKCVVEARRNAYLEYGEISARDSSGINAREGT